MAQASDGYHQIGTARMGDGAKNSIVDANCRVHRVDNLYVVSSAVFSTGGQANPTLLAVALAFRLGEHLSFQNSRSPLPESASRGDVWMRSVFCSSLQREVSALGFGCEPLGSRVAEACGRRAFDKAYDLGVTWYDVAPSYGDGCAEAMLGKFLVARRDRVVVCTKYGIPRSNFPSLLRPAARIAVRAFSPFRKRVAEIRAAHWRKQFKAEMIEASLTDSLRNLRTDYLDVLALHEPSPSDCTNDEVLTVLHRVVKKGYVRLVSIAGPSESIVAGVSQVGALWRRAIGR